MKNAKYIPRIEGHALVLGGSGGIGSEVVRALVANGVKAISFTYGSNKKAADALSAELKAEGVKSYAASVDFLDAKAFEKFLDEAVSAVGEEISLAVNAVGISPDTPLQEQTAELWRKVYDVNVVGPFLTTRSIADRMKRKSVNGSIILITSTNGINSQAPYSAAYDSSKAAEAHMMKILAEEYAPDIRINGVAPGWIETKMNDTLPPGEKEKETEKTWAKRFADPAEIASAIVFFLGSGGSFIYGQNLVVDGGYR